MRHAKTTYSSILQIDLVAQHYEGEMLGISWAGLDQEFVSPRVQVLECVWSRRVEDEHAAISATVEGNAK